MDVLSSLVDLQVLGVSQQGVALLQEQPVIILLVTVYLNDKIE